MDTENSKVQENNLPDPKSMSVSEGRYHGEDSYVDESELDNHLDITPVSSAVELEFKQENLSKNIPNRILVNLIGCTYPDLVTENNNLTMETLTEILREGANLNNLDCLSDKVITDLAR